MPMDIRDIIKELEMDGDANEALGFENVLLILNKEDPDILDVMKDMVDEEIPHKENMKRLESVYEKVKV